MALKLQRIGNSVGVTLPRPVLEELHLALGDTVYLTESADGVRLTPYSPDFEAQMKVARKIMKKRRNAYRELARR